jgi:hypothetical protein
MTTKTRKERKALCGVAPNRFWLGRKSKPREMNREEMVRVLAIAIAIEVLKYDPGNLDEFCPDLKAMLDDAEPWLLSQWQRAARGLVGILLRQVTT